MGDFEGHFAAPFSPDMHYTCPTSAAQVIQALRWPERIVHGLLFITMSSSSSSGVATVLGMMLVVAVPAALAVSVVVHPTPLMPPDQFASPWGYTLSLGLFIVPIGVIAWWFLRHPGYHVEQRAFWLTVGVLAPMGFGLDILLGNAFFTFINQGATLGLDAPGYMFGQGWVWDIPIEEFIFYFTGFLAVLLFYIWNDLYWLNAYACASDVRARLAEAIHSLFQPHWRAVWVALGLVAGGLLYKYLGPHPYREGFPGYFTFLTLAGLLPTFALFKAAQPLINWRAFSLTLFVLLLVSLLWEGTLGVPYQWWGYRYDQMLGLTVKPWGNLPIEAVIVWLVVAWATIIFYETVRIFLLMNRPLKAAVFGPAPQNK